jgi:hypothetical protein
MGIYQERHETYQSQAGGATALLQVTEETLDTGAMQRTRAVKDGQGNILTPASTAPVPADEAKALRRREARQRLQALTEEALSGAPWGPIIKDLLASLMLRDA